MGRRVAKLKCWRIKSSFDPKRCIAAYRWKDRAGRLFAFEWFSSMIIVASTEDGS